jgi:heme/copper-type cytochrome/quinol oxidase subunit 4
MLNLNQREQKSNNGQRPFLFLAFLIFVAIALFPFGWLASVWPEFSTVVEFIFGTDVSHIIGHFAVFMLMGGGVLRLFPSLRQRFWRYVGLMLLLGMVQEFLQIASFKHIIPAFDEILDLTMDMVGTVTIYYFLGSRFETGD